MMENGELWARDVGLDDAPHGYDNGEAWAWVAGFEAAKASFGDRDKLRENIAEAIDGVARYHEPSRTVALIQAGAVLSVLFPTPEGESA